MLRRSSLLCPLDIYSDVLDLLCNNCDFRFFLSCFHIFYGLNEFSARRWISRGECVMKNQMMNVNKINEPLVSFVSDLDKNLIWDDILQYFTLQADDYDDINDHELKELVRKWAMKKMATQF